MITRPIPSSGERLPVTGLGTWSVFDTDSAGRLKDLASVLHRLHEAGGRVIDSSPMYGKAEAVVGQLIEGLPERDSFFYATKVWTSGKKEGIRQLENSFALMKRHTMDLVQVHNLVDWQTQLATLREWKAAGRIRYIGITHYTDSAHDDLEHVMRQEKPDFVQFNYSITSTHAEKSLLPAAQDLGIATIINRPLGEGKLIRDMIRHPLPSWAIDWGINSWPSFLLKYIISHPAVTCVIPATANPAHAKDNLEAGTDFLPDEKQRKAMHDWVQSL